MSFYEEVGARTFINARGSMFTRYGGTIMPDIVTAAMAEASKQFVNLFELQDQVGRSIAALTGNEAAFVSCGAASGILLCAAAVMAGVDEEKAARLPACEDLPNQFIMQRCAGGTEADPAIRAAGGRIVAIGPADRPAGTDEFLNAINERTAAIVLVLFGPEVSSHVEALIVGAHKRKVPVLIDGACALPPRENLWRYTHDHGADAFVTSGGKAIRGPQTTGLVLGKPWIIEACKFHASPNLRIGRGMKVGKEEFAGIYTALKRYLELDEGAELRRQQEVVRSLADHLVGLAGAKISFADGPSLQIKLDPAVVSNTAEEVADILLNGDPSILLSGRDGKITIHASLLQDGEERIVADQLRQIISAANDR